MFCILFFSQYLRHKYSVQMLNLHNVPTL